MCFICMIHLFSHDFLLDVSFSVLHMINLFFICDWLHVINFNMGFFLLFSFIYLKKICMIHLFLRDFFLDMIPLFSHLIVFDD